MFVPNYVFNTGFEWFCRICSGIFLVVQLLLMIDFVYDWNDAWVQQADCELNPDIGKQYLVALLVFAAFFFTVAFVGIVLIFVYYPDFNAFTAITLVMSFLLTCLQLVKTNGSLLSSSLISVYSVWILYSSIRSFYAEEDNMDNGQLIINSIISCVTLCVMAFNISNSIENGGENSDIRISEAPYKRSDASEMSPDIEKPPASHESVEAFYMFHLIMIAASTYMGMLLTDWGTKDNLASMWVKIVSQWIIFVLYGLTLLSDAP
jgi:hypothetical protein